MKAIEEIRHHPLYVKYYEKLKREDMGEMEKLIYNSDKQSRKCFACEVQKECDWDHKKKNFTIEV